MNEQVAIASQLNAIGIVNPDHRRDNTIYVQAEPDKALLKGCDFGFACRAQNPNMEMVRLFSKEVMHAWRSILPCNRDESSSELIGDNYWHYAPEFRYSPRLVFGFKPDSVDAVHMWNIALLVYGRVIGLKQLSKNVCEFTNSLKSAVDIDNAGKSIGEIEMSLFIKLLLGEGQAYEYQSLEKQECEIWRGDPFWLHRGFHKCPSQITLSQIFPRTYWRPPAEWHPDKRFKDCDSFDDCIEKYKQRIELHTSGLVRVN